MEIFNLADERLQEFPYKMRLKLLQIEVNLQKFPQQYHAFLKQIGLMTKDGKLNLEIFRQENLDDSEVKMRTLYVFFKNNPNLSFHSSGI